MVVECRNHLSILAPYMKIYANYISLLCAIILYAALCIALHPMLGYLLDSDGVAYLTIAKRVADGQYIQSINGLWSPLNSWLLVPFIQHGMDAWLVAKLMNVCLGAIVITLTFLLFQRFNLTQKSQAALLLALAIVMVHNVYLQVFGDILQLIFLLSYLLILWSDRFASSYWKAILCALMMGIGFYAKAYSLAFFLVHFAMTLYWYYKKQKIELKRAITLYGIGVITIILTIAPWTFALHKKYGDWSMTGHAGKLNMSWQINSGKTFREDIKLLIPPTYNDSPSFWEDPYPSQQHLSTPMSSPSHFIKWIARIIHTVLMAIGCMNDISSLAIAILLISFVYFFFRKKQTPIDDRECQLQLLIITALTIPLGYLMMHIETRYIWINSMLTMILGAILLEKATARFTPLLSWSALLVLASSFIVFPILDIKNLAYKNKDLFTCSDALKNNHIQGSFTSNGVDAGRMWVVAYLTKNPFYTIERSDYSIEELISEMKRYKVQYYLFQSENNKPDIRLTNDSFHFIMKGDGYDIYSLK